MPILIVKPLSNVLTLIHYPFDEAFANPIVVIDGTAFFGGQVKETSALGLVEHVSRIIHTSEENVIFGLERCHRELGAEEPASLSSQRVQYGNPLSTVSVAECQLTRGRS